METTSTASRNPSDDNNPDKSNRSFVLRDVLDVGFQDRARPVIRSGHEHGQGQGHGYGHGHGHEHGHGHGHGHERGHEHEHGHGNEHDVLVRVKWTGICGSDSASALLSTFIISPYSEKPRLRLIKGDQKPIQVHYYTHGEIGQFKLTGPMVLGHESSGTVVEVGDAVATLKPGDLVAMEPGVPCRQCVRCKEGRYNLCAEMRFAATPPHDGTLAKYYVLPEDFCWRLPGHGGDDDGGMTAEEGALIEPLAVAVHVVRRAEVGFGDSVVVFGAGPVGLLCCAVAKVLGASKVIAVDIQTERLEFAKTFAATAAYKSQKVAAEENAKNLREENQLGTGADIAIDASGAEPSVQTGIHVLRTGGTYVQCGMGADEIVFPITAACTKELKVLGSFRYGPGDYPMAIDLVARGRVDVKRLISNKVAFEDAEQAFVQVKEGKGIKVLIAGPEGE